MSDASAPQEPPSPGAGAQAADPVESAVAPVRQTSIRSSLQKLKGLFERWIGPPPYKIDLGRIAAVITVPVLCWVFFTTSSGMIDIMRRGSNDWVGLIGTLIGTTAILIMLAATSWSLGSDLGALITRRQFPSERIVLKAFVTSGVFLFVFSISAFFSFTYYYNNIFMLSSRKIVSELQPMELSTDVLLPASKQINARYDSETARIVSAPGMRAYLDALEAILQGANNAGPAFREGMQRNREALNRAAAEAARKAAAELQEAQAAGRQIDDARNKIAALDQIAADLEPIIKSKQDEIASLTTLARQEDQLALDASKGLDNLGAVCGSNCESHRAKAAAARKRAGTIRETLVSPLNERANAIKQRDALAAQILTLRERAERVITPQSQPVPKEEPALDLGTTVRELTELQNQIRSNPTWAKIREAKASCALLFATERQLNIAPKVVPADFACEPSAGEARDLLTARDEAIAGRDAFDRKCSLDGAIRESMSAISLRIRNAPDSDKSAASTGFNEAKQIVDACVLSAKSAGLSEPDVQSLLKQSDLFLRTHSLDRNRFELAREAFMSFTPDATMAIGVAVAQDAFIFVMKLLSEIFKREVETREQPPLPPPMDVTDSDMDDCDVRVLKTLLRGARPIHGGMSAFDANGKGALNLPDEVKDNLIGLLNRLVREGIAYIDRTGRYVLDDRTLKETEARLESARKRKSFRVSRVGANPGHPALIADADDAWPRRRRRSALERYLAPRFFPTSMMEEGVDQAAGADVADPYRIRTREYA